MSKNLVIVESPAKAKTINKYLGNDFKVVASYGHVRDLIPKEGAVDTENFEMHYELIKKNKKHVDAIIKEAKASEALFLATDPDREGEAISWHVYDVLKNKKALANKHVYRVVFHEITRSAVDHAIKNPRSLSMDLVNAQQARRALDYLVGFNLSPLLWKKIRRGLSAGRVQSPALRLIVEREQEIETFNPKEYWTVTSLSAKNNTPFAASLIQFQNEKLTQFSISNGEQAKQIKKTLDSEGNGKLVVNAIEKKQRKRNPFPPFITSTLQQDASRKLGFSAQKTMRVAQQLYEGIDIGSGEIGLITYMRTDSVNMAQEAIYEIRSYIEKNFGSGSLPAKAMIYRTKSKNAQEAHEAIRPTSANLSPTHIKNSLSHDQYRLYDLIWKRSIACQMVPATINTVSVDFACGDTNIFRATGSTIETPGFLAVYEITPDDANENEEKTLPSFSKGESLNIEEIQTEQHFTKPPPRYSEAALIKSLEEFGIGRPSTYATIIFTLLQREYVELESKRFKPTDVGRIVNKFLTEHFNRYVDFEFTAQLEDELDAISRGEHDWIPVMKKFWSDFHKQVNEKTKIPKKDIVQVRSLGTDPKSGRTISVRMARYGTVAQIGTPDDDEKPLFASLKPGQSVESITLEEALKLFDLPRDLGTTDSGESISVNIGRYGPYVRVGKSTFISIKEDDPYTITLERANELIAVNSEKNNNKIINEFDGGIIKVLNGRYGPYISNGKVNARIPKGKEPKNLSREECLELLDKAASRPKRGKKV